METTKVTFCPLGVCLSCCDVRYDTVDSYVI
jgi:hypothetical protein